jgi:hypothetical protein
MTKEQEEILDKLVMKLEDTDYSSLMWLAEMAYNKAIEDVLNLELLVPDDIERLKINFED